MCFGLVPPSLQTVGSMQQFIFYHFMAEYSVAWNMMFSSQVKSARMIWVFLHLANFLRYFPIFWELSKKLGVFFVVFFLGGGGLSCITVIWTSWCCKTTKTNTTNNASHHLFDLWHNVILHFTYLFDYYEYWGRRYTPHRKHWVNKVGSVKVQHKEC